MSRYQLFRQRQFLPFFIVQALGALNDNVFKNAVLVLIVSGVIASENLQINTLVNFAAAVFILPFFLFSALAGQLADKYDKALLIRRIKLLELVIMVAGAIALLSKSFVAVLVVVFAMGAQSTFFGPIKYSILPQQLSRDQLMTGNALVETGTFAAILLGTMAGSYLAGVESAIFYVSVIALLIALVGWIVSSFVPSVGAGCSELRIDLNVARQTWRLVKSVLVDQRLRAVTVGLSWFWFIGACYLTQIPNFVVSVLAAQNSVLVLILCCFTLGIGMGAMLCDAVAKHRVRGWIIFAGLVGISVFSIDLSCAIGDYDLKNPSAIDFLAHGSSLRILIDLVAIGLFGGIYTVPLYTALQVSTSDERRARVVAANNVMNSLFLLMSSVVAILMLARLGWSIPEFFLFLGVANGLFMALLAFLMFSVRFENDVVDGTR